jgi:hypothetical protein
MALRTELVQSYTLAAERYLKTKKARLGTGTRRHVFDDNDNSQRPLPSSSLTMRCCRLPLTIIWRRGVASIHILMLYHCRRVKWSILTIVRCHIGVTNDGHEDDSSLLTVVAHLGRRQYGVRTATVPPIAVRTPYCHHNDDDAETVCRMITR